MHDIINYSIYICPFQSRIFVMEGKKLQKIEYLEDEKSFIDEINFFLVFKELSFGKKIKI